ncbi:MAG: hypothetical protein RL318_2868 [Fibrobacterota bacterium]
MTLIGRTLTVSSLSSSATVSVYDNLGHRIAEHGQGAGTSTYGLQNLSKGLYIVHVKGYRESATQRIVVY